MIRTLWWLVMVGDHAGFPPEPPFPPRTRSRHASTAISFCLASPPPAPNTKVEGCHHHHDCRTPTLELDPFFLLLSSPTQILTRVQLGSWGEGEEKHSDHEHPLRSYQLVLETTKTRICCFSTTKRLSGPQGTSSYAPVFAVLVTRISELRTSHQRDAPSNTERGGVYRTGELPRAPSWCPTKTDPTYASGERR